MAGNTLPGLLHHSHTLHNRVWAVMEHIPWYTVEGRTRLANDAGVSRSAVSRLVAGKAVTSAPVLLVVAKALERRLGRKLDLKELVSADGTFPTPEVCRLVGCSGCLPDAAYEEDGSLRLAWEGIRPGTWTGLEVGGKEAS